MGIQRVPTIVFFEAIKIVKDGLREERRFDKKIDTNDHYMDDLLN